VRTRAVARAWFTELVVYSSHADNRQHAPTAARATRHFRFPIPTPDSGAASPRSEIWLS
jgi:hypothetical protein